MTRISLFITLIIAFASCHSGPANFEGGVPAEHEIVGTLAKAPADKISIKQRNPLENQKIIREGTIEFETKDLKSSRQFIADLCKNFEAYIQEEANRHSDYQLTTETILRIPAEKYDAAVALLEEHAFNVTQKNIKAVDVTDEFVDVQARLKAKYELERRYLDLLKRAKNVEEVLAVEAQMSGVRYEIESMEGRMRSLSDRITLSTLNLSFYQTISRPTTAPTYASKLADALQSGWDILLSIFVGVVFLWPFIIFFTIGVFATWKWKRRHREQTPLNT